MKNRIYTLIIMLFVVSTAFGQTSDWQWAISAGEASNAYGWGVSNDVNGNVYATGHFYSETVAFGNKVLTNANNGSSDMFVVKYDSSGNIIWAKSAGGTFDDGGQRIAVDAAGNVVVIGDFNSSSIIFGNDTLIKATGKNIFVVKYDQSGNVIWAKSAGGISKSNYGQGVSIDNNGNVYITGAFESDNITFGNTVLANTTPDHKDDIFIVKYDSSGNVNWAKSAGGSFMIGAMQFARMLKGTYMLLVIS